MCIRDSFTRDRDLVDSIERFLFLNVNVYEHLRIADETAGQFRKAPTVRSKCIEHEKSRHHPITDQTFLRKYHVARLFSPELRAAFQKLIENVFISHRRSHERQAA